MTTMDIEVALGPFYSTGDKARFFAALGENGAVKDLRGVDVNLILCLDGRALDDEALRDLLALLWRYRIPLAPLYPLADQKRFQ